MSSSAREGLEPACKHRPEAVRLCSPSASRSTVAQLHGVCRL